MNECFVIQLERSRNKRNKREADALSEKVGNDPDSVLLVNTDVDSVCATRILQYLFKCEHVLYTILPISGTGIYTTRILQYLFKCEHVLYTILPISGTGIYITRILQYLFKCEHVLYTILPISGTV